ncbi:LLM class flavin-dependent oxidoreductase [Pseudomonas panipatensis]|uniref:FMN-dependent oxidoreductase, nitrilotriacetate monooxygenase family n=1 Tax=Pseudomonas panipatensis TaxID=428992 RepID=A0A1G8IX74_9PSED|nr:LLM class flavin-dependent oxidoreductase [Pseudomonas panipatensis]SDI23628.1 FMN-dependent oxidoreductase, nitrilotriacetate monooxygenase family [Pseudomonas panipatensis]SMP48455.1 FMN-dependent oxidoreductase, nitrilotriacetate monooxygenase family [Pseudomonas panipatensis]
MSQAQIKLGAFLMGSGHHLAAWRHPRAHAAALDFQHYLRLARTAERGKFDSIFFADNLALLGSPELASRTIGGEVLDPLVLLSGLATATERIGLISTVSTSYNDPYLLARRFASLDHLSGGRAGWNLVTSATDQEAHNFGRERHFDHAERYAHAEEFIDVAQGLWDSFEDDAFLRDKASGRYFDPRKLHTLDHQGTYYRVRGPLNLPRSPQGRPVLVQAGSSEPGRELAARTAEVVFTAQQTLAEARAFYGDLKARLARYGRHAEQLKIMPGISPVLGRTQSEAEDLYAELQNLVEPSLGLGLLSGMAGGIDLSAYPLDGPLPALPESNAMKSRQALFIELARRENLTIRQLYLKIVGARGHCTLVGTPLQVADHLEEWFREGAADGFNIMPPLLPEGLDAFVDQVVPELQRRGLFRREYEGRTLRENLGLERPAHAPRNG